MKMPPLPLAPREIDFGRIMLKLPEIRAFARCTPTLGMLLTSLCNRPWRGRRIADLWQSQDWLGCLVAQALLPVPFASSENMKTRGAVLKPGAASKLGHYRKTVYFNRAIETVVS